MVKRELSEYEIQLSKMTTVRLAGELDRVFSELRKKAAKNMGVSEEEFTNRMRSQIEKNLKINERYGTF